MSQTSDMHPNLPSLLLARAAAEPDRIILRRKARGIWKGVSWHEMAENVRRLGAALAAEVAAGETVAILAENRPETAYADLAAQCAAAASAPIPSDTEAERLRDVLIETQACLVFVENEEQLDKLLTVRAYCRSLRRIVIIDMKGLRSFADPQCISLDDFVAGGDSGFDLAASVGRLSVDGPAAIVVTQQAMPSRLLTHGGVMQMLAEARRRLAMTGRDERLAVLGPADPVERIWGLYAALDSGCVSNYLESSDTAVENLQELQPTVLGVDAEAWAHLHARATTAAKGATTVQRVLYDWALRATAGGGNAVARWLVLGPVRRELGLGRLRLAYTGGAGVPAAARAWAQCLGVTIQSIDEIPANPVPLGSGLEAAAKAHA